MIVRGFASASLVCVAVVTIGACEDEPPLAPAVFPDAGGVSFDAATYPDAGARETSAPDADGANDSGMGDASSEAGGGGEGKALRFDGVDDGVSIPSVDPSETAFSVELWFKTTALSGTMFEVVGSGGDRFLTVVGGKPCFYVYNPPNTTRICGTSNVNDGAWHHIAGTLGATGGMRLYVDTQLVASSATPTTSSFTGGSGLVLGYGHYDFSSPIIRFAGDLDDVRLWQVERSAADIAANYDVVLGAATAGLQGYWKLDGSGTSTVATDETAGGANGTLVNFSFTADGGPSTPWVTSGAF